MESKYRGLEWLDEVYGGVEKQEPLPDWRWFLPTAFVCCILFFVLVLSSADRLSLRPCPPKVSDWVESTVKKPNTLVWDLAKEAAADRYDITGVGTLISQKNNLKGYYNLYPGQKVLTPVFGEKKK